MTAKKHGNSGKKWKEPKTMGRPLKIPTPEIFDERVDSYIALCQKSNTPITLLGLVLALGLCDKMQLYDYQGYPDFSLSVKRARSLIEHEYEKRLLSQSAAAGPIFALKNFGWMDKHPTELDNMMVEKLRRELEKQDEDDEIPTSIEVRVVNGGSKLITGESNV